MPCWLRCIHSCQEGNMYLRLDLKTSVVYQAKAIWARHLIILLMLFSPLAQAQPNQDYFKVGLAVWSGYPESVKGFKQALADKGLIEGQNVEYFAGAVGADKALQTTVAQKFKAAKLDMVYSLTTPGTIIMKEIMPESTPIVFSIVTYPADSGLIESFEYSGNNLVGTSNYIPLSNHVALLELALPEVKKVAIFHRKGEPNSNIQTANMIRLLKRAGINAISVKAVDIKDLRQKALSHLKLVDAFITTTDTLMQSGGELALIDISLQHRIPIVSSNKKGIEQGSTFGPVADFYTLGHMAGLKAVKILLKKTAPTKIESELQDPPLFLANPDSIKILGLDLSGNTKKKLVMTQQ